MPPYCQLSIRLKCPKCGFSSKSTSGKLFFFWGESETPYKIGDEICWAKDAAGATLPPFAYFKGKPHRYNTGNPEYPNVDVFASSESTVQPYCPSCRAHFDYFIIRIRSNQIDSVICCTREDVARRFMVDLYPEDECDIFIVNDDGTFTSKPDWFDPVLIEISG